MSPIELPFPPITRPPRRKPGKMEGKGQSHNYPATTKGNPVETTPPPTVPATPPLLPPGKPASGIDESIGGGIGRISRYRIASMAARFRIAWPDSSKEEWSGCPGTFSQSLCKRGYHDGNLCVSFECDSLSEELERRREKRGKKFCGDFLFSAGGSHWPLLGLAVM